MSTFEREDFRWRETYFILFDSAARPTLQRVEKALKNLNSNFEIVNQRADDQGRFDSLTCLSPDDYAALDISYLEGEEVIELDEEHFPVMLIVLGRQQGDLRPRMGRLSPAEVVRLENFPTKGL